MNWKHEHVQTGAAIAGVVVSLLGFTFVGYQVSQAKNELYASTHERLLRHNSEILTLIVSNPDTRPYFYESARLQDMEKDDPGNQRIRNQVLTICEIFTDLFEHVAVQRNNMPEDVVKTWDAYVKAMYCDSFELRKYMCENADSYPERLHEMSSLNENWPDSFE